MKCMVIDGNSILNRSFHGIRPLTTREGLYTHAIYGFLTTLLRMKEDVQPDALCVTFDLPQPTFRHRADPAYKANRRPMPEELRQQLPVLKEVLDALNIPRLELPGWEADDLIGTVCRRCEAAGWECVALTGDRDVLQLIGPHTCVKLMTSRGGQPTVLDMTEETFRAQYGFDPIRLIDLKALMGDASDNIPGVPGVGEKTAMALIGKYGSIDAIYQALPDIDARPAVIERLSAGEAAARHAYFLATIATDAPLDFDPAAYPLRPPGPAAYGLFLRLELNTLIQRLHLRPQAAAEQAETAAVSVKAERVTEAEQAERLLARFRRADHVTLLALPDLSGLIVDLETGPDAALSAEFFSARYQGDWTALLQALFGPDIPKVSHNVKDLMRALLHRGLPAEGFLFDTALAAYLLDPTAGDYDLPALFAAYCGAPLSHPDPLHLAPDAFAPLADTAEAETAFHVYTAAVDALYGVLAPQLNALSLQDLFRQAELPLCRVLAEMELTGCRVDKSALAGLDAMLQKRIAALEQSVFSQAGETFNLNSPRQLGEILFGKLGLPHGKKTKTGWSTGAQVLERLAPQAPIVAQILEYRQCSKLRSTYAQGLLKAIDPDGRVRTRFQMTATATGRLSSAEPNLQNIPVRQDLGSEIRRMFIPAEGCVLVDADYSQIELRILAHVSGDAALQAAFRQDADIHTATAAQVFGLAPREVTPQLRRRAKAVNFGIVYGISPFSLGQDLGVSQAEARAYMDAYFETFPGVRRYMDAAVETARRQGYAQTLFHRRRPLPELTSSNFALRSFGERVALNMPIQGTAADVIKLAMAAVYRRLKKELPQARLVLQVHDELIVECPRAQAQAASEILQQEMEGAASLSVPLTASAHWGLSWLEAKD